jgi:predicted RecA/RadA family phage recombinase
MTNFVDEGNVVTLVAPGQVNAGEVVVVGSIFGVAAHEAANGAQVDCQVVGIFDLKKVQAEVWAQGDQIYWDQAPSLATTVPGPPANPNTRIGVAVEPAANPSDSGRVRLSGAF